MDIAYESNSKIGELKLNLHNEEAINVVKILQSSGYFLGRFDGDWDYGCFGIYKKLGPEYSAPVRIDDVG